jgi:hypothetical protein
MDEQESNHKNFTKNQTWTHLKEVHKKVHGGVHQFINDNAKHTENQILIPQAKEIDKAISDTFLTIQQVKRDNCQN